MWTMFFISLIPLVLFAIINHYKGLDAGVWSSIGSSVLVALIFWFGFEYYESEFLIMVVSLTILGIISIKSKNQLYIKLQPVITGVISVLFLLWFEIFDESLLVSMLPKMSKFMTPEQASLLNSPSMIEYFHRVSIELIIFMSLHTILIAYIALKSTNRKWVLMKAIALPFLIFGIFMSEIVYKMI